MGDSESAYAKKSIYDSYRLMITCTQMTVYTGKSENNLGITIGYSYMEGYTSQDYEKATEKVGNDLTWTTSDPSVAAFHTGMNGDNSVVTAAKFKGSSMQLYGVSEGKATISVKSALLGKTFKCKVTVKDAEFTCEDGVYYNGNTYQFGMKGNASGVTYSSSDTSVAKIDENTGKVTALKKGSCTLSCVADNGKTYTYKLKVNKSGLTYATLTSYYYSGFRKGCYTKFPIVAKGIGKCTITCTSKSGKTYKCKLTVVGGKWGGLTGGYLPKVSTVKKHGYYSDINTIHDYGKAIVCIFDDHNKIKLNNGNSGVSYDDADRARYILQLRYPDKTICSGGGDYLLYRSEDGKNYGRIYVAWYYVK